FRGKLWITQHGDARDHVVASGESFTIDQPGLALIEALEPSSLVVLVEPTTVPDPIGYEAAWPQLERDPRGYHLHEAARRMRAQSARKAVSSLGETARKLWSGLSSTAPERQVV